MGNLGVEIILQGFFFPETAVYWEKLILSREGGSVSSHGVVSAVFKAKLLLQPLEGLLWLHSKELAWVITIHASSHCRALGLSRKCSPGQIQHSECTMGEDLHPSAGDTQR